jgi:penicillin-binding protein 2
MTAPARIQLLVVAAWLAFGGLTTRLYALQVRRGDELRSRAERRRRRVDFLSPRRGKIVDRKGRPLALDRAVEDVVLELTELDPALDLVPRLGRATHAPIHEVARALKEARAAVLAGASAVRVGVAADEAARVRAEKLAARFPGLVCAPRAEGGWSVMAPASLVGQRDRTLARLAPLLGTEPAALRALVQDREDEIRAIPDGEDGKGRYERLQAWGEPLVAASDVSFDQAAAVEEASAETAGFTVVRRFVRAYPRGDEAAHVVGFLASLSEPEGAQLKKDGLLVDESEDAGGLLLGLVRELPEGARLRSQPVGRAGLEGRLDRRLAGRPGARVVERDAGDRSRETLLDLAPRDGEDVNLSLDLDLQAAAEKALDGALEKHGDAASGGAAVLLDLASGDVLALASAPRFDPNAIAETIGDLAKNPAHPFCHRAVAAVPPGSTFKVVSSFAFFGEGGLALDWTSDCEGALARGQKGFHCDDIHGPGVGLTSALAHSCNIFFFRAADLRGSGPLVDWGHRFGFGRQAAGTIPLEQTGRVPGGAGPVVRNQAIGQGDVTATPLQVARLAAAVATGGRPRPTRFLLDGDGPEAARGDEDDLDLALDPRVLAAVRAGLEGCVDVGTASRSGLKGFDVAGKTGTAERAKGEPNYAWFMGYYPASRPEVAFSVLVDRTRDHGGDVCGPVALELVKAYARSRGEEPRGRAAPRERQ